MKKVILFLFLIAVSPAFSQENAAEEVCPLLPGSAIPDVTITDMNGEQVALKKLTKKPTVLVFYRGGWCPYCNKHLAGLQEAEQKIKELGYQLIAVSADNIAHAKATLEEKELSYQLYSDNQLEAAKAFQIAFRLDEKQVKRLNTFGLDIEEASGESHHLLPVPAVFIIKDKIIRYQYVNPNYKERLEGKTIISLLESLE